MSAPAKTRSDFQQLSATRIEEAEILLNAGKWDGAYYIAGYSIECALKACIITRLMASDAFPEKRFSENCYKHDLELLLELAGLKVELNSTPPVAANWLVVHEWNEKSRYEIGWDEFTVRKFLNAITDAAEGILPWIQSRW